jgi:hypothetical protein
MSGELEQMNSPFNKSVNGVKPIPLKGISISIQQS